MEVYSSITKLTGNGNRSCVRHATRDEERSEVTQLLGRVILCSEGTWSILENPRTVLHTPKQLTLFVFVELREKVRRPIVSSNLFVHASIFSLQV